MNRLSRAVRLDRWFASLRVMSTDGSGKDLRPVMTVAQGDATSKLTRVSGQQIVAARSELHRDGNSDGYTTTLSTVFFTLEKGLGIARTEKTETEQYERLASLADSVLARLADDIEAGSCCLLTS